MHMFVANAHQQGARNVGHSLAFTVLFSLLPAAISAQVIIDGSTSTNVVVNSNGSVTVGIAPSSSNGVSLNRFEQFNVSKPGVHLDNRTEAARTIVNEVTGTSRTDIEGPVEVLGQRAHVIVANPNGIVINGGRFVNTGRIALTTGKISTNARQIAPGIFQNNVLSTVEGGSISIEGGGLSGQMDALDLIAHSIRVNGPVTNESTNSGSSIRIAAGDADAEFDSSVLPGNTGLTWGTLTDTGAESDGAILVEITRLGVLRANRIGIEVSDKGAGVRFAGEGYATARGFSLSTDGRIDLSGANIETTSNLTVSGGSIKADGSKISASAGAVSFVALDTDSDGISGSDFELSGQELFLNSASDLSFGSTNRGTTTFASTTGDIVFQSSGAFTDAASNFTATRNLVVNSNQSLNFSESDLSTGNGSIQLDTMGSISANGTLANAFAHFLVTADDVMLASNTRRTEFKAENGSFILTTFGVNSSGNLTNAGGLIQGGVKIDGLMNSAETVSDGAVTLNVEGRALNTTANDLAVIFGAAGDVSIRTSEDLENNRGRILANGDVRLIAQGDVLNMVEFADGSVDPKVVQFTRKGRRQWWTLWTKRKREAYVSYDYGTLKNTEQLATIVGTEAVSIEAEGSLINQGGDISANDGDLEIKALRVETIGLGSGKVSVRKTCVFTCSYEGDGSVEFFGGRLNASNDVRIDAAEKFHNKGGSVFAIGDINISTPDAVLEAALVPTVVVRPKGIYNFLASRAAWIFLRDQYGAIVADSGNITVNSNHPIKILGGSLTAGGTIDLENGEDIVRAPGGQSDALNNTIGLFADVPLIRRD